MVAKAVPQGFAGRRRLLIVLMHRQGASHEIWCNKLVLRAYLDIHMYRYRWSRRTQYPCVRSLLLRGD